MPHTSQRLNDLTATGLQILTVREGLTGLAKARFENQLMKTNKALLDFAEQVAEDDLLPTRLPDKVKKPKWAKPRKTHGKASARAYTGAEAAETAANRAEQSSRAAGKRPARETTSENSSVEDVVVPRTPPRPAGESQGGTTLTLAMRTPERLHVGPDLAPKAVPTRVSFPQHDLAWQLPASTAPPGLGQAETGLKRKRAGTAKYRQGREDGYTASIGLSQPRDL